MYMSDADICREYKLAKNPKEQILILADENCCKKDDIIRILVENGMDVPTRKKKAAQESKKGEAEEVSHPAAVLQHESCGVVRDMPDSVRKILIVKMEEIENTIAALEKEYKEIANYMCGA